MAVAVHGMTIQCSNPANLLPTPTAVVSLADSHDRAAFAMVAKMKEEPMDVESVDPSKEDVCLNKSLLYHMLSNKLTLAYYHLLRKN